MGDVIPNTRFVRMSPVKRRRLRAKFTRNRPKRDDLRRPGVVIELPAARSRRG